tara:strand:+ start:2163 stop:2519 length:357 start_codon:yes stop_codon:yes gene_type:complete
MKKENLKKLNKLTDGKVSSFIKDAEERYRKKYDIMEEMNWGLSGRKEHLISDNDLGIVSLPVKVVFEWSDEIVAEYDFEKEEVVEFTSGYIMKVIDNQSFVYNNEETTFVGSLFKNKK